MASIHRLRAGEGERLREVRMRALRDTPWAFDSPYEEEVELDPSFWEGRARQSEVGDDGAVFLALGGDRVVGMAGGFVPEEEGGDRVAVLWGMWVEAGARGTGTGRALVDAVVAWAEEIDAAELRLAVSEVEAAAAAAALYRRAGFVDTGVRERLRSDPSITLAELELRLRKR